MKKKQALGQESGSLVRVRSQGQESGSLVSPSSQCQESGSLVKLIMLDQYARYQASKGRLDFVNLCENGVLRVSSYSAGDFLRPVDASRLGIMLPRQFATAVWVIGYPLDASGALVEDARFCMIIEPHFTGFRESGSLESGVRSQESGV